ncbi:MAG TPA: tetraacyldisaccharide 4'-kinase [Sulfurovum sp.]|uniref:tetraacyldisaccharide 4'-kinase n=1 Tax=Sulfurovum sp. TaxID=1969726 RepID=UPI002F957D07
MRAFFEAMFFSPKWYHYPVILLLLPFSLIYGLGMWLHRSITKRKSFGIPIVSVGNLIVGGSGKTPFVIAVASGYTDVTVISRGYGRQSRGVVEVSRQGEILVDVEQSGDEAMLMATALSHASVIVSEDRPLAIEKAMKQGAKLIILDDGFNRMEIEKFEILLEPGKIRNPFPFPAGPFREFFSQRKHADCIAKEGKEFLRQVEIADATEKMLLVTAISNPARLDSYLPKDVVGKVYLEDHAYFDLSTLQRLLKEYQASSILCTSKDRVKMEGFKLPISEMKLKLEIKNEIVTQIDEYIKGYRP